MVIKIAVDSSRDDVRYRVLDGDSVPISGVTWNCYAQKTFHDTKYAMVNVNGWEVEFHDSEDGTTHDKWLIVCRKADKAGPEFRETKLRIRNPDVGGTLVLKLKKKVATAKYLPGDLSVKIMNEFSISRIVKWGNRCRMLNRIFSDETGKICRTDIVLADSAVKPYFAPNAYYPDAFDLTDAPWALAYQVYNETNEDLRLTVYTTLSDGELERALYQYLQDHGLRDFFQMDKIYKLAAYRYTTD